MIKTHQPEFDQLSAPEAPVEIRRTRAADLISLKAAGPEVAVAEPASTAELWAFVRYCRSAGIAYRVLGRGSNTLIRIAPTVIVSTRRLQGLAFNGDEAYAESGVGLQKLIRAAADRNLGGIEYLWSVPGTVGGAVCMNAGRGWRHPDACVGRQIVSVRVLDGVAEFELPTADCAFAYRSSVFRRRPSWVILGATLRLAPRPRAAVLGLLRERTAFARRTQDLSAPNAGTAYSHGYAVHPGLRSLSVGPAAMSRAVDNWILNTGGATADQIVELMERVEADHADRGLSPPVREVVVW